MKTAAILLLLASTLTAMAATPSGELKISAPQHPGARVRIAVRGCESGIVRVDGKLIVFPLDIKLDGRGQAITRLFSNNKELYCNPMGLQQVWSTRYGVQIMDAGKEKIVTVRAGKTSKVKL